ncbi:MAG: DNA polymerase III subunit chi [Xanthomonadales bacterium]|nr:DNA polymerase III subunit chi [Xanthomonadales bacterium]
MNEGCQVDFYLLKTPGLDERRLACRLSLMAWERGHRVSVVTEATTQASELSELMWESPSGRFLPHDVSDTGESERCGVSITTLEGLNGGEVVINLCGQPLPEPQRFSRILEIVPQAGPGLEASRDKFRYYRQQGIEPAAHDISK